MLHGGAAQDAHLTAIHTIHVNLEGVIERADLIAVVSPVIGKVVTKSDSQEFVLVKILHAADNEAKVPKRFAVGASYLARLGHPVRFVAGGGVMQIVRIAADRVDDAG